MSGHFGIGSRLGAAAWRAALATLATLVAAAFATSAAAQDKTGTTLGQFMLIEPGARVSALGNAGASLAQGLDAVYYNPAAAGSIERYDAVFSRTDWLAGIRLNYLAFGMPVGRLGNVFATVTSLSSGNMLVRTVEAPNGTGEQFSVSNLAVGVGYAKHVTPRFSVGGQLHWLQETIWHSSVSTATLSFGTLYRVTDQGFRLGSSLSYFGTQGQFDGNDLRVMYDFDPDRNGDNGLLPADLHTDRFDVPVLFRVGVGQTFTTGSDMKLDVALDALHPSDDDESVNAGVELTMRRSMAFRLGWQDGFLSESETGLTAGLGFTGQLEEYNYRVDYGWADFGRLGDVHRLSFGVAFGGDTP